MPSAGSDYKRRPILFQAILFSFRRNQLDGFVDGVPEIYLAVNSIVPSGAWESSKSAM